MILEMNIRQARKAMEQGFSFWHCPSDENPRLDSWEVFDSNNIEDEAVFTGTAKECGEFFDTFPDKVDQ